MNDAAIFWGGLKHFPEVWIVFNLQQIDIHELFLRSPQANEKVNKGKWTQKDKTKLKPIEDACPRSAESDQISNILQLIPY